MSNTTAVATQQTQTGGALVSLGEIEKAAQYIATSGMFGAKTKEQAAALMLVAQSEGLHYARAAMAYDVIHGRPALKSSEILSRFQASGGKIKYKTTNDNVCEVELEHPQGGVIVVRWDMERVQKAGIVNANYTKYPAQMLRARAVAEGVRALYPACLGGFYAPEEVQDFEPAKEPQKADAEVIPEAPKPKPEQKQPDLKINIDGTPPPPPAQHTAQGISEQEAKALCEFIKGLADNAKAMIVLKKFCEPKNIGTLSHAQADKLVAELKAEYGITYDVVWRDML